MVQGRDETQTNIVKIRENIHFCLVPSKNGNTLTYLKKPQVKKEQNLPLLTSTSN